MAKKADLITAINNFITAIITPTKHRSSMLEVVNQLYPTQITDQNGTSNIMVGGHASIFYVFRVTKQGSVVHLNGFFFSSSQTALGTVTLATITNTEYRPNGFYSTPMASTNSTGIIMIAPDGVISNTTPLAFNETYTFNLSYTTE
jgi:hypothetical protein